MGAVLKGRDPDLGRDLAVKVLLDHHKGNPDLVRRFVEEAQITGQLQHPGVVPVHELGRFGDDRPFFTMKLVKGRTLADLLSKRAGPDADQARFLAIFLDIAQTTAYAHSRWVIHRDLKPSNVMVGSFGEVQVMDWGLAKVLPRGGAADDAAPESPVSDTVIVTERSEADSDHSKAGSVLGTPAYMASEQARGEVSRIDRRADVFSLGSILCEILTGKPAYTGRGAYEIIRKATLGDLSDAFSRLDASRADADLIALARQCLAPEPEDRPIDAKEVADRLIDQRNTLDRRLRDAELTQVADRARSRAERQALRIQFALAASLFGLMALGALGYAVNQGQRAQRISLTARTVDEAIADAARLRGEAQSAPTGDLTRWVEAHDAAKRADSALKQGEAADAMLRDRVAALLSQIERERAAAAEKSRSLKADRELRAALESIRGNRAEHWDFKRSDADYAAAFLKAGLDLDKTEPAEAGRRLADRTEPVELASYLDDWAYTRRRAGRAEADWRRLVAAAKAADPDPWRQGLREKVDANDEVALAEFRRLADDEKSLDLQPAASLVLLAIQLKHLAGDRERAARILRRVGFLHPDDFWSHYELADVFGANSGSVSQMYPRPEESVRHLTTAVAIRPRSNSAHNRLGLALHSQGKLDEAMAEYRFAIRINPQRSLGPQQPRPRPG